MQLNERQKTVVDAHEGRVVVLAGPGSGKTATLVARIRALVAAGAAPGTIAACTFTVRAANELTERLDLHLGFCGTIHGLAREILMRFPDRTGLGAEFSVLDEDDVSDLYRAAHAELRLRTGVTKLRRRIQELQTKGGDPDALPVEDALDGIEARKLELGYRQVCARLRATDFDGLIRHARTLLITQPDAARAVRQAFLHLCVDEAQDLDPSQDQFLDLVAPAADAIPGTGRSTLFVGDPLQSIYAWRGGTPGLLIERAKTAHTRVMLGHNFRSTKPIVELANRIAADDPLRPPEYQLLAMRDGSDTDVWSCRPFPTDEEEISRVVGMIQRARIGGIAFRDIAVLGRTNGLLATVAERMAAGGVPFQHLGQRKARLEQEVCRGAIAYLRLAVNTADDLALTRAVLCPARAELRASGDFTARMRTGSQGGPLFEAFCHPERWAHEREVGAIDTFVGLVEDLRSASAWPRAVDELWSFLQQAHRALGLDTRADELAWMRGLLDGFLRNALPGARRWRKTMGGFLWWLTHGQGAAEHDPEADAVTLSTIHLAKGLEFPVVFLPGLVERVFPSAPACNAEAAGDPGAMDEERRCFFVAATRAKDRLVLTRCAQMRDVRDGMLFPAEPSRWTRYVPRADVAGAQDAV